MSPHPVSLRSFVSLLCLSAVLTACGGAAQPTPAPATAPPATAAQATLPPPATDLPPAPTVPVETAIAGNITDEPTQPTASAPAGFVQDSKALNRDVTQAAFAPALAASGLDQHVWVTWAEAGEGGVQQIFVSELVDGLFQARGASLNAHTNVVAEDPIISFAGEQRKVPWVAWTEPSPSFNNVKQVFASRFNATTGLWQPAGVDRGSNEPSLNLNTTRSASHPFVFSGSGDPVAPPVPWVTWEELSSASNAVQIFVAAGVKDEAALGGFRWDTVGEKRGGGNEPTLNVNVLRDALHPVGVFAESGNAVPWVTWHETGANLPARIFTARGVADAKAPGGFKWINVPACTADETSCALNVNPLRDAKEAQMAAGSLKPGEAAIPWIAWAEVGPTDKSQIFVDRLDVTTRNRFLNVGASLNADQNHDAKTPFITFINNVPYVSWLEDDGTGRFKVQVRHLASDPQTGTWALDTPPGGFNFNPSVPDFGLFTTSSGNALFMAWVEGSPALEAAQVVVGHIVTP